MKLNLGCGANKLEGYTNIDINASLQPDIVHDFTTALPFEDTSVDQVVMFHVIEHIEKQKHLSLLLNVRRVLKSDGILIISYPEFSKIAQNWLENRAGKREFWEATIYGRQSSPSDYHVCCMDSDEFIYLLKSAGYRITQCIPEPMELYNTVVKATPDILQTYSDEVKAAVWGCHEPIGT